jgi:hypothetical protein
MPGVSWLPLQGMGYRVLTTVFALLQGCLTAAAQGPAPLPHVKSSDFDDAKPGRCESRGAELDGLTQSTPAGELIIVIARLGGGETNPDLNWRRLHNVRVYWTEFLGGVGRRRPETIVLAAGARTTGYGRLEFYVGGGLVHVMKVARGADISIGECYPPDDSYIKNGVFNRCEVSSNRNFYPCREKNARQRRKR